MVMALATILPPWPSTVVANYFGIMLPVKTFPNTFPSGILVTSLDLSSTLRKRKSFSHSMEKLFPVLEISSRKRQIKDFLLALVLCPFSNAGYSIMVKKSRQLQKFEFSPRFNFGSEKFKFPPKKRKFQCFNDHGKLSQEERIILPR